jgi:hypothetical protein
LNATIPEVTGGQKESSRRKASKNFTRQFDGGCLLRSLFLVGKKSAMALSLNRKWFLTPHFEIPIDIRQAAPQTKI